MPNPFAWLFRGADRQRAFARYGGLQQSYGDHGSRVIKLSARTDLLRKSAGSTQAAFDYVERAFADATQEYARIGTLMEGLQAGLERGKVGDFTGAESALRGLGPKFDELERRLTEWESRWQEVPRQIDAVAQALADLLAQVQQAEATAGGPLPVRGKVEHMQQHLDRIKDTLQQGNPVEAGHMIEDMAIARQKVEGEAGEYVSGAGAIAQAEADLAQLQASVADPSTLPADAAGALAAAEALGQRLRPALTAGDLGRLQQDLLSLHQQLNVARQGLSPA